MGLHANFARKTPMNVLIRPISARRLRSLDNSYFEHSEVADILMLVTQKRRARLPFATKSTRLSSYQP
jgi:hypothetical protein